MYDDAFGQPPEDVGMFPAQQSDDIHSLVYLGYLEETIQKFGHTFTLKTLDAGEELEVALLGEKYSKTIAAARALAMATVAASLQYVDGEPFVHTLGPNDRDSLALKFQKVRNYYWPTVEGLYLEYQKLQLRAYKAFEAFEDLSDGSRPESSPYADSSNDRESSKGEN